MNEAEKARVLAEGKANVKVIFESNTWADKYVIIQRGPNNTGKVIKESGSQRMYKGATVLNFTTIQPGGKLMMQDTKDTYEIELPIKSFKYLTK